MCLKECAYFFLIMMFYFVIIFDCDMYVVVCLFYHV